MRDEICKEFGKPKVTIAGMPEFQPRVSSSSCVLLGGGGGPMDPGPARDRIRRNRDGGQERQEEAKPIGG